MPANWRRSQKLKQQILPTFTDRLSIPEELERRGKRLAAIAAAKAEIERHAVECHDRE